MLILCIWSDLVLLLDGAHVHASEIRNGVCESAPLRVLSALRVICTHCIKVASYPHQLRIPIKLPHVVDNVVIHGVVYALIMHNESVLIRLVDTPMRGLRVTSDVGLLGLEEELLVLPRIVILDAQAWGAIRQGGLITEDVIEGLSSGILLFPHRALLNALVHLLPVSYAPRSTGNYSLIMMILIANIDMCFFDVA